MNATESNAIRATARTCGDMRINTNASNLLSIEGREMTSTNSITALPVQRDQYGYWTHPAYEEFCAGRESIASEEFDAWLGENGLEWRPEYRDEDDIDPSVDGYDISAWQPSGIKGDGWFVGSIHDTEDGAVCIWLRKKEARNG